MADTIVSFLHVCMPRCTYAIVSQEISWYFLSCHVIDDVWNIFYIYFSGPDINCCHHYVWYHHERSSLVVVGHMDQTSYWPFIMCSLVCNYPALTMVVSVGVTGRPRGSVAQWSECLHGLRGVLGSSPGRAMCFFLPCDIWWLSVGPCSGCEQQMSRNVSSVPAWFRADSGTNLIKQGEIVTGRPCGSVAQWSECSHGMREVLGTSPGRAMCVFPHTGHQMSQGRKRHIARPEFEPRTSRIPCEHSDHWATESHGRPVTTLWGNHFFVICFSCRIDENPSWFI